MDIQERLIYTEYKEGFHVTGFKANMERFEKKVKKYLKSIDASFCEKVVVYIENNNLNIEFKNNEARAILSKNGVMLDGYVTPYMKRNNPRLYESILTNEDDDYKKLKKIANTIYYRNKEYIVKEIQNSKEYDNKYALEILKQIKEIVKEKQNSKYVEETIKEIDFKFNSYHSNFKSHLKSIDYIYSKSDSKPTLSFTKLSSRDYYKVEFHSNYGIAVELFPD